MDEEELQERGVSIHAGFPNAAVGSHSRSLDLTKLLITHPASTFLMKLDSDEWQEFGMGAGDIIIVDRALEARKTDHVIWWEHDQFCIGKQSAVPVDSPIWGVVSAIIHPLRGSI